MIESIPAYLPVLTLILIGAVLIGAGFPPSPLRHPLGFGTDPQPCRPPAQPSSGHLCSCLGSLPLSSPCPFGPSSASSCQGQR